jgi:urate oxidase
MKEPSVNLSTVRQEGFTEGSRIQEIQILKSQGSGLFSERQQDQHRTEYQYPQNSQY